MNTSQTSSQEPTGDFLGDSRPGEIAVSTIDVTYEKEPNEKGSTECPLGDGSSADEEIDINAVYKANRRANLRSLQNQHKSFSTCTEELQTSVGHMKEFQSGKDRRIVPRDKKGRRVDLPLAHLINLVEEMERTHYCNSFHLNGRCSYPKCKHLHMVRDKETRLLRRLDAEETETLRFIARRSPCRNGTACDAVDCWAGHRCINHVKKGRRNCCFPESMHFEYVEPVNLLQGTSGNGMT